MKSIAVLVLLWFSETRCLSQKEQGASRANIFSPRMDYDEWTPLGRGDPLKNDPTYDYVPPVLERVHYWIDPGKRTPDPPHRASGLLVLGSRTESAFAARPTTPGYYHSNRPQADSRIDASSLLDPFFKLMDGSPFGSDFDSGDRYEATPGRVRRPQHQSFKQKTRPPQVLQRPPYTMLMPPPPPPTNFVTSQGTTAAVEAPSRQATVIVPPTPALARPAENSTAAATADPTVLADAENVFKPVAISMPGSVGRDTRKPQAKKPTTEEATTTRPVPGPPVAAAFETNKKQPAANPKPKHPEKQRQPNANHLHLQTTAKYVPRKTSAAEEAATGKKPEGGRHPEPHRADDGSLRATTAPPPTTAGNGALTTDPMFKHYKQPSEPVRGPFYLIIQGHSKVKTYGASKNPVNRLLTSNEIKSVAEEEKSKNSERKGRRARYDDERRLSAEENGNGLEEEEKEEESGGGRGGKGERASAFEFPSEGSLESLEETFPKSNGGSSKKRYLGSNHRRKRFVRRKLLAEEETGNLGENLDLESLIATSDDYDPEDVADILFEREGSQGSGFGGLASSVFPGPGEDGAGV